MVEGNMHQNIIQNLKDSGCNTIQIQQFINALSQKDTISQKQVLVKHKLCLIHEVHKYQKQIDCLDHLVYILTL